MFTLTERQKFHALVSCCVVVFSVLIYFLLTQDSGTPYVQLRLSYTLTQKRAVDLTALQMNGTEALLFEEIDDGTGQTARYKPPRLHDIIRSMEYDSYQEGLDGVCAMNYNVPVSVCYVAQLGHERGVLMFNLKLIGFSPKSNLGHEHSLFCERGTVPFGVERFEFVWIEFYDANGERNVMKLAGKMSRVIQQLAWLNQGYTICDPMSLQRQADILFEVSTFRKQ